MKQTVQSQIIKALNGVESQLDYVRNLIHLIDEEPKQENALDLDQNDDRQWLPTKEFARRANLRPKTIANYARDGFFTEIKKTYAGHYLIHISELEKWGP